MSDRYDPKAIEAKWQRVWSDEQSFHVPNPEPGTAADKSKTFVVEMLPYPSGELHMGHTLNYTIGDVITHLRRRMGQRVLRPMGYDAFGLPAENAAIREGAHPRVVHRAQHRHDPVADEADGLGDRLVARDLDRRPQVLPLDAVAVPPLLRARPRLPQGSARQLVPEGSDRARERAGDRRPLRALRHRGRGAQPDAVVLQDHRLRRRAARRDGAARVLARARADDAAELDRPLRGRAHRLPRRWQRRGAARLHDAARHALRRHVLRARARAPARGAARRRRRARGRGARIRPPRHRTLGGRARAEGEGRRLHRPLRRQPGQRRADPDLGRRLRPDGLRHRRDHGRARARRARPRVRGAVRHPDRPGGRARRRRGRDRHGVRRAQRRRAARQLRRVHRPECSRGQAGDRRVARRPRRGRGHDQLPPARLAALAAALLGLPDPDRPLPSLRRGARARRPAARRAARDRGLPAEGPLAARRRRGLGATSTARAAAARPSARPTRWTRSSTRPGT